MDDPLGRKLSVLKQNLQRCIYSNSRAEPLERLDEDDFVLDKELQERYEEEGNQAIKSVETRAQSILAALQNKKCLPLFLPDRD